MAVNKILEEIDADVADVASMDFEHVVTSVVPGANDSGLTYERGFVKKGKVINTCVLFVDIRNSVALTEKHHNKTMGKIYTAFSKAVIKVARHHGGHTRNIIGDRVMIVFPTEKCFTNAVDCAISINHIAQFIIRKKFPGVDFKCGIGIDYGELRVIKVGIQRNGTENGENKGLVWVGYPANIASRLTDYANKQFSENYYEVELYPYTREYIASVSPFSLPYFSYLAGIENKRIVNPTKYKSMTEIRHYTPEKFAESMGQLSDGSIYFHGGKLVKFQSKSRTYSFPEILMTEKVYNGFKAANPLRKCIKDGFWKEQKEDIENVNKKVFGGNVFWDLS